MWWRRPAFCMPPTNRPVICPSRNTIKVGIASIRYFRVVFRFLSVSNCAMRKVSLFSEATSLIIGAIHLQGGHQSAQKYTTTGNSDAMTRFVKFSSVTSNGDFVSCRFRLRIRCVNRFFDVYRDARIGSGDGIIERLGSPSAQVTDESKFTLREGSDDSNSFRGDGGFTYFSST